MGEGERIILNNIRRNKLSSAIGFLVKAEGIIRSVCSEESDALCNIPENLQESDRAYDMENIVDILDQSCDDISEIICTITDNVSGVR